MANWTTKTVLEVVESIRNEDFVLPVIQRRLVWDEDKMALLFDTILKGLSFGGIIAIKESRDFRPLFASRPFSCHGEDVSSQYCDKLMRDRYFVIDGQQRLQSLYIGLCGSINGKTLFMDITGIGGFMFAKDERNLRSSLEDEDGASHDCCWVKVKDLVHEIRGKQDPYVVAEIYCKTYEVAERNRYEVSRRIATFQREFIDSKAVAISEMELPKDVNNESRNKKTVVELFRRLNDGGTRLSAFDLVASVLKSFSYEMEEFLETMVKEYDRIGLTQDNLIKLLFILEDAPCKELTDIEEKDAEFAIQNRIRVESTLNAVNSFLTKTNLQYFIEKYRPSFIPLFFVAYHIFHSKKHDRELSQFFDRYETTSTDFILMRNWIYHSFLNDVFRSKGAGWIPYRTGIRKIHACISQFKSRAFPAEELFAVYRKHPLPSFSTEYDEGRLPGLNASFVYFLIYGETLRSRTNDVDHIMPRALLEKKGYDASKINSICNFQLLDYGTNRGDKNKKSLYSWLNQGVKNQETYLKTHKIPVDPELWKEDNFELFLKERAKLLLECIKQATAV